MKKYLTIGFKTLIGVIFVNLIVWAACIIVGLFLSILNGEITILTEYIINGALMSIGFVALFTYLTGGILLFFVLPAYYALGIFSISIFNKIFHKKILSDENIQTPISTTYNNALTLDQVDTSKTSKLKHFVKKLTSVLIFLIFLELIFFFFSGGIPIGKTNCANRYVWRPSGIYRQTTSWFVTSSKWLPFTHFFSFLTWKTIDDRCEYSEDLFGSYYEDRLIKNNNSGDMQSNKSQKYPGGYVINNNTVYFLDNNVGTVDQATYEIISPSFAKDKNRVYSIGTYPIVIPNANPNTFQLLSAYFAKDDQHIYFLNPEDYSELKILTNNDVDVATYKILPEVRDTKIKENRTLVSVDKEYFYSCGDSIISNVGNLDDHFVIHNGRYVEIMGKIFYVKKCHNSLGFSEIGVWGDNWKSDAKTFKTSPDPEYYFFANDKFSLYISGYPFTRFYNTKIDFESFEWLMNGYAKDKNDVYFYDHTIGELKSLGKNPKTFIVPEK